MQNEQGENVNDNRQTKIIVIEDDQAMRSLIGEFLELQGHQTQVFQMAAAALEDMREHLGSLGSEPVGVRRLAAPHPRCVTRARRLSDARTQG